MNEKRRVRKIQKLIQFLTEFFKRARIILISTGDIYGISFENCLLNEDELYISNILRN